MSIVLQNLRISFTVTNRVENPKAFKQHCLSTTIKNEKFKNPKFTPYSGIV